MESIHAYQDLIARDPKDRDIDWYLMTSTTRKDVEMILTLFHWEYLPWDETR